MKPTEQQFINKCALRPYTTKELYLLYGVSDKTFRKWLAPFQKKIGQKRGAYFTINQVKIIFRRLGTPGVFIDSMNR